MGAGMAHFNFHSDDFSSDRVLEMLMELWTEMLNVSRTWNTVGE